jgi:hypothetical protein
MGRQPFSILTKRLLQGSNIVTFVFITYIFFYGASAILLRIDLAPRALTYFLAESVYQLQRSDDSFVCLHSFCFAFCVCASMLV